MQIAETVGKCIKAYTYGAQRRKKAGAPTNPPNMGRLTPLLRRGLGGVMNRITAVQECDQSELNRNTKAGFNKYLTFILSARKIIL